VKKVIITGFGAFHTHRENPSEALIREMTSFKEEIDYQTTLLPVVFSKIPGKVSELGPIEDADALIFCGLAASRNEITPEKIALNWVYSPERKDNEGVDFHVGRPLIEGAPLALMSTFNVEGLSDHFNNDQLKSRVSFSAGTYVCNQTFFEGLNRLKVKGLETPCTFLHLPSDVDVKKLAASLHHFLKTTL